MIKDYKDLIMWQKSMTLAEEAYAISYQLLAISSRTGIKAGGSVSDLFQP